MAKITLNIKTDTQNLQQYHIETQQNTTLHLQARPGVHYELFDEITHLGPKHIAVKRHGNDLLISFDEEHPDPADIIIENYYETTANKGEILGELDNGTFASYVPTEHDAALSIADLTKEASAIEVLETEVGNAVGITGLAWVTAALALGGIALGASSGGGGSDSGNHSATPPTPVTDTTAPEITINPIDKTNDNTPTVTGQGEPGALVEANVNGKTYTTTIDENGNWYVEIADALPEGSNTITIIATDEAGNKTTQTTQITVDTLPPEQPQITSNATTADTTPDISGTAEAGSTITLKIDDDTYTGVADETTGAWTITIDKPLEDATHTITVTATDQAGNTSAPTQTSVTIDTTGPEFSITPITSPTNDKTPAFSGTTEAGSNVTVKIGDKEYPATVTTDATTGQTHWHLEWPENLQDGDHTYTVIAKDALGNTSPAQASTVTVDSKAPNKPVATINDEGTTISGSAEPNSTIIVKDENGEPIGTGETNSEGNFEITLPTPRQDGGSLTVEATDKAGNTSAPTEITALGQTTPLSAPEVSFVGAGQDNLFNSTKVGTDGKITAKIQIPEDAKQGNVIEVTDESGAVLAKWTVANTTGDGFVKAGTIQSIEITVPTEPTSLSIKATISDKTGHEASSSASTNIDIQAPTAVPKIQFLGTGSDNQYNLSEVINGQVKALVTFADAAIGDYIIINGQSYEVTATNRDTGIEVTLGATSDHVMIDAYMRDTAGNLGTPVHQEALVDTQLPNVNGSLLVSVNGDVIPSGGITQSRTLNLALSEPQEEGSSTRFIVKNTENNQEIIVTTDTVNQLSDGT